MLEESGYLFVSREAYCGVKRCRRHCNRYRSIDAEMADDRPTDRPQPQVEDTKRTLRERGRFRELAPEPLAGGPWGDGSDAVRREPLCRNRLYAELHGGPEGAVGRKKAADELPNEDAADEILVREISRDRGLQAGYVRELLKRHGASAVCESLSCCPSSSST